MNILTIFVMLMATPAMALTNLFSLNQTMTMDLDLLLGQTINLKVDKETLDNNNTIYTAKSEQSMTFTEVTGIKLPSPMDGMSLTTKSMFTVQETKKPNGSSFNGKISVESPWIPVDLASIPFSGELYHDRFKLEAMGKTFNVQWYKEGHGVTFVKLDFNTLEDNLIDNILDVEFQKFADENAFLIGVDYKGLKGKLNFSYNSTLEQFQVVINKVGIEEDVIKLGSISLDKDRMVKSTFSAKEYPQLSEHLDKIFLTLGKFWFGEKCTLEKATKAAMVMFEWSSALTPRDLLDRKGFDWFELRLPAFLFPSWA